MGEIIRRADEPHGDDSTLASREQRQGGGGDTPAAREHEYQAVAPAAAGSYDSRTQAGAHTTAARLHKQYQHAGAVSGSLDKRSGRPDDGHVTSQEYARESGAIGDLAAGAAAGNNGDGSPVGAAKDDGPTAADRLLELGFRHPLERWLGRDFVRRVLRYVTRARPLRAAVAGGRPGGIAPRTVIEEVLASYANPRSPLWHRVKYWPLHRLIDWLKGSTTPEAFRQRISEHTATVRGLVVTVRSVGEFGLTVPQRFSSPLFGVWNFTNRCNLRCQHCYQDSAAKALDDELTLAEKLGLVEQLGEQYLSMLAFAGGEPTISHDLLPVLRRCRQHGIHTSVATNGTTMTPRLAAELADAGVKYVEVSLDSVRAEKHDAFRGQPGMWERSVGGMRVVVAQPGLRLGIAMCIHQGNVGELEDMLRFAVDVGASCFAHFNFIPVGRGLEMAHADLTPRQREQVLRTLNEWMQAKRIGIMSTAPQLGRVCLAHAPIAGQQSCAHTGTGSGAKARVVAKYLGGCGAGRTYVCIEPNGDITPCVYLPHRVLGNIRQRRFIDIYRHNEFRELLCRRESFTHHCEVCQFRSYCGGCRARADGYFGALNAGDPGCIFNEKHWEELLRQRAAVGTASEADAARLAAAVGGAVASERRGAVAVRGYDGCVSTVVPPEN